MPLAPPLATIDVDLDEAIRGHLALNSLWDAAVSRYREQTGDDLTSLEFVDDIRKCNTAEEATSVIESRVHEFAMFRKHGGKMKDVLRLIVKVLIKFSDASAEVVAVGRP